MNSHWAKGARDMNDLLVKAEAADNQGTTFEADTTIKLPLSFGNKDAAAFHRFKAYVSAIITDQALSDALKESLAQALETGQSLEQWKKSSGSIFDRLGYDRLNPWQTRTIWRTETSLAYGAGQFAKLQEVSERFPYWEYDTAHDSRVRPSHKILQGKIFRSTDKQYYPPLGFNCRCTALPITKRQAQRRGIEKPDTVTPEMNSQLANAEFIGDKVKSFEDWLNERTRQLTQQSVQLIVDELAKLIETVNQATQ